MTTFDKSRPYGELLPPRGGAAFTQDGRFFSADGREVPNPDGPATAAPDEAPPVGNGQLDGAPDLDAMNSKELQAEHKRIFGKGLFRATAEDLRSALREFYS